MKIEKRSTFKRHLKDNWKILELGICLEKQGRIKEDDENCTLLAGFHIAYASISPSHTFIEYLLWV